MLQEMYVFLVLMLCDAAVESISEEDLEEEPADASPKADQEAGAASSSEPSSNKDCTPNQASRAQRIKMRQDAIMNKSRDDAYDFGFQWVPRSLPEGSTAFQQYTNRIFLDFTQFMPRLMFIEVKVDTRVTVKGRDGNLNKKTVTRSYIACNNRLMIKHGSTMNMCQKELLSIQNIKENSDRRRYFRFRDMYTNALQNLMYLIRMDKLIKGHLCMVAFYSIVTHPNKKKSATLYCPMSEKVEGFRFLRISSEDDSCDMMRLMLVAKYPDDERLFEPPVPAKLLEYLNNDKKSATGQKIYQMVENYKSSYGAASGNVGTIAVVLQD